MSKAKLWVGPVFLEPIEHKYHHRETGKIYKSVTTTLTSIEPHFDAEAGVNPNSVVISTPTSPAASETQRVPSGVIVRKIRN